MDRKRFQTTVLAILVATGCASSSDRAGSPASGSGAKKAYIGLFGDKAVAVLDTASGKVLTTIPVSAPDGLVITPDGAKVFVSSTDSGTVKVIATSSDTVLASIDVGAKPAGLAITPDGKHVIVSVGGANAAVILDTTTNAIVSQAAVALAHSSCVSADGHFAYVGSQAPTAPAVVVVDITGAAAARSYPVDRSPRALAWTPRKVYFSAVGLDALEVMDPTTGVVGAPIPTGGSPHDTRPTRDGKYELVVSQTAGDLELVDPTSDTVVAKVPTGKMPHWIALTSDGTEAYVTNEGDNDVVVVDLATHAVVATIAVGNAPRKIALQP